MSKFRLTDEQVIPAWKTLIVEVRYVPNTGSIKPWELYGCFTFPFKHSVHWGSFKTEAAAQKAAIRAIENNNKFLEMKGEVA